MSQINTVAARFTKTVLTVAFAILIFTSGSARSGSPEDADAEKAIRAVLESQVTAWNDGNLEKFMDGYWHSPQLTFFSGKDKRNGWQETIDRYRKRYQASGHLEGKLSFSELQIEPLGPRGAFVRGRWRLATDKETLGGLFTLIFKKLPEGWRIVHDHTSG